MVWQARGGDSVEDGYGYRLIRTESPGATG
jgi:hypothetical protein